MVYPEGADKLEQVYPFDDLTVTFTGTAPNGKISFSNGSSLCNYTADKESGLRNGDVVTVTAEFAKAQDDKVLAEETKEYTVEGLLAYVESVNDIPADTLEKINSQGIDTIKSNAAGWSDGNSIKDIELIGCYFLSVKEGFSADDQNILYCVYKVTANITGKNKEDDKSVEEAVYEEVYYNFSVSPI